MAFVADLKWHQHRRPCFWSRKHHRRILALTSRLAASVLHVLSWLSVIAQHSRCQSRSQWFVPVRTHSVSQSHLLAKQVHILSGFAHVLLTTSISGSIVEGIHESTFSISSFLQHCTSLYRIPPKFGAPGGLNFQTIFFWAKSLSILALSHSFKNAFSSLAAPTKFVPLSLMILPG